MLKKLIAIIFILFLIALIAWFSRGKQYIAVDSCLDSGGKWNEEINRCETVDNQKGVRPSKVDDQK